MTPVEQAKAYALAQTGLKWDNLSNWTDAQRRAYLSANSEFRQRNPGMFSPAELAAASNYEGTAAAKDPEFSYVNATATALGERLGEIGGQVAGVGEGIFTTLSLARYLIPIGVIVVAVVWLRGFARRNG